MKIVFGLHLDGEHGWRPQNRLGKPVLGPLGFLNLLETRLGLLRAECIQAQGARYRYLASEGVSPWIQFCTDSG
jgi:hypothetical protein